MISSTTIRNHLSRQRVLLQVKINRSSLELPLLTSTNHAGPAIYTTNVTCVQRKILERTTTVSSLPASDRLSKDMLMMKNLTPKTNTMRINHQQQLQKRAYFHSGRILLGEGEKTDSKSSGKKKAAAPAAPAAPAPEPSSSSPDLKSESKTNKTPPPPPPPVKEYSTAEITRDAAKHKAGLSDPDRPPYQNPLHHNNPDKERFFRNDFASEEEFQKNIIPIPPLQQENADYPQVPDHIAKLADECLQLSMLEMNELVDKIAEHYGFSEDDLEPTGTGAASEGDDDDKEETAAPVEEKTTFDVKLVGFDEKAKIKVIKEVRALVGLGLKEAKEMVEGAPAILLKDLKKEAAEEIKNKLQEIGAQVEII